MEYKKLGELSLEKLDKKIEALQGQIVSLQECFKEYEIKLNDLLKGDK